MPPPNAPQLLERPRVHHVLRAEPAAPGDPHAVPDVREVLGDVGVRRDRDPHASLLREPARPVAQVEAFRHGVHLERDALLARHLEHGLQIELVRVAVPDAPAGRMAEHVDDARPQRPDEPVGHALARLREVRVDARDHPIEPGERLRGQVERAVGQDVHLDAGEETRLAPLAIQRGDTLALLRQPLLVEPERARARVIRDGEVPSAAASRLVRELLERGAGVGRRPRVDVQVAEHVPLLDETWERARLGSLKLAGALAQLGRDPGQPDGLEHVLLALPRAPPPLAIEHAVLAELDSAVHRPRADGDVVRLAAGEVVEGRAERLRRQHAEVHLQPDAQPDGRLGRALREHGRDLGEIAERPHHRRGLRRGDEDVEVADGLLPAPHASGRLHRTDARDLPQLRADRVGVGDRAVQRHARGAARAVTLDRLEDRLRAALAHSVQLRQSPGPAGLLERVDVGDPEHLPDGRDRLWTDPLDREQLDDPRRHARRELVAIRQRSPLEELADPGGDALADGGDGGELALAPELRDRPWQRVDHLGGLPVGPHLVGVAPGELEQVGQLGEGLGDFRVLHCAPEHWGSRDADALRTARAATSPQCVISAAVFGCYRRSFSGPPGVLGAFGAGGIVLPGWVARGGCAPRTGSPVMTWTTVAVGSVPETWYATRASPPCWISPADAWRPSICTRVLSVTLNLIGSPTCGVTTIESAVAWLTWPENVCSRRFTCSPCSDSAREASC